MRTIQEDGNARQKANDARQQEIFAAKQAALQQAVKTFAPTPIQPQPFGAMTKQSERS